MSKKVRFATLVRVSTEKQKDKGESLSTQTKQIENAVKCIEGGVVTATYAGQEHGTPGWERKQLDKLLQDACRTHKPFDAVMVADPSRWSRDNVANETGLDVLRDNGIRFFVLGMEFNLYDPMHRHMLATHAGMNKLTALLQKQKSLLNRIERAKRGVPTTGKLPFGRAFDTDTGKWSIIPEAKRQMEDVAKRYLAGVPMGKLAEEYGCNHSTLHKNLMHRCGTKWEMEFKAKDLNISETVTITIPRLLPEATIQACQARAARNKTFSGTKKFNYLLGGFVYCGHCGYMMNGQTNHNKLRYYRHTGRNGAKACDCGEDARPWVRAEEVEDAVMSLLFETFGNPEALARAIEEATPNAKELGELRKRTAFVHEEIGRVAAGRDRVVALVAKGRLTDAQVDTELDKLEARDAKLREELAVLEDQINNQPTPELMAALADRAARGFRGTYRNAKQVAKRRLADMAIDEISYDDARAMVMDVFDGKRPDGRPCGIYITNVPGQKRHRHKRWRFTVHGKVIEGYTGTTNPDAGCVAKYGWHLPAPVLLARRSRRRAARPRDGARRSPGAAGCPSRVLG